MPLDVADEAFQQKPQNYIGTTIWKKNTLHDYVCSRQSLQIKRQAVKSWRSFVMIMTEKVWQKKKKEKEMQRRNSTAI